MANQLLKSSMLRSPTDEMSACSDEMNTIVIDAQAMDDTYNVLVDQLTAIYQVEQQLVSILPQLLQAAETSNLREVFETHLKETHEQIRRLENAAEDLRATWLEILMFPRRVN